MKVLPEFKEFARQRGKEVSELLSAQWTPECAKLEVAGQEVTFRANVERIAAWKIYVELSTRVATQELRSEDGLLREALSSLYQVFPITRAILKDAGPNVCWGERSLGAFAMRVLNEVLRPFLAKWHPLLREWEEQRADGCLTVNHEQQWIRACELREDLAEVRGALMAYCDGLADIAGITVKPHHDG